MEIAIIIAKENNASVSVITYNSSRKIESIYPRIRSSLQKAADGSDVEKTFELRPSQNVVASILEDSRSYDLIILGASDKGIFNKIVFGNLPETIANTTEKQMIMVKSQHGLKSFVLRWLGS